MSKPLFLAVWNSSSKIDLSIPRSIVKEGDRFRIENTDYTMSKDEFINGFNRFIGHVNGTNFLCSQTNFLSSQKTFLLKMKEIFLKEGMELNAIEDHLSDLDETRQTMGDAMSHDDSDIRSDLLIYDAMSFGLRDYSPIDLETITDEDTLRFIGKAEKIAQFIDMKTAIDAEQWKPLRYNPIFQNEYARKMARDMLSPILGNAVILEDVMHLGIPNNEIERLNALKRFSKNADETKILEPFKHYAMPGYQTSAPELSEKDGVSVLIFNDHMMHYAYVWVSNPDIDLSHILAQYVKPENPKIN